MQESTLTIRRATLDDIPVIIRHKRLMFEEMGFDDMDWLNQMDALMVGWLEQQIPQGRYLGWFAVEGDSIAAGVGLYLYDWPPGPTDLKTLRGYIQNVYTEPPYRKRGLARALMNTLLEWCREHDIVTVGLHASGAGRPMYASMGFEASTEMMISLR